MFSEARFVKAMLREYELCVNYSVRGRSGLPRLRSTCRWGAGKLHRAGGAPRLRRGSELGAGIQELELDSN